jgi:hypothetical protein
MPMRTSSLQPISNDLASQLISEHLRATSDEAARVSAGVVALVVALIVLPLALLLIPSAIG